MLYENWGIKIIKTKKEKNTKREKKEAQNRMKIYKFECKKCSQCCRSENLIVTITHRDLLRIYYDLNIETIEQLLDLVAFYEVDLQDKKLLKRLIYPPFIIGNSYYILGLNRDRKGICKFLKDKKCTIYESRPKICKIFPFTFLKDDDRVEIQINKLAEEICQGINKGPIVIIKEIKKLWTQIMKEKKEYEKLISVWNQLVTNGMLESNPETFLNFILGNISIKA